MTSIYGGDLLIPAQPSAALWLLPALPLAGAAVNAIAGAALARRLGPRAPALLALGAMLAAAAAALAVIGAGLMALPADQRFLAERLWRLGTIAGAEIAFDLALDPLAAVMALVVIGVGAAAAIAAVVLPAAVAPGAPAPRRHAQLGLLAAALLLVVLGDGFATVALGWGAVGVAVAAGTGTGTATGEAATAFVVARAGDLALVVAAAAVVWAAGGSARAGGRLVGERPRSVSVDAPAGGGGMEMTTHGERSRQASIRQVRVGPGLGFRELDDQLGIEYGPSGENGRGVNVHGRPFAEAMARKTTAGGVPLLLIAALALFVAAASRSAALPLTGWWPAPAETTAAGPALLLPLLAAAGTGVYLLARFMALLALAPVALAVIAAAGALTALVAAAAACVQRDMGKVLAYAAAAEIGAALVAVGAGAPAAAVLQVVVVAAAGACLGVALSSAGAVRIARPAYAAGCLALGSAPLASGFFSKSAVALAAIGGGAPAIPPAALVAALGAAAALVAFAVWRSYFLTFAGRLPKPTTTATTTAATPGTGATVLVAALAVVALLVGIAAGWPGPFGAAEAGAPPPLARFLARGFTLATRDIASGAPGAGARWAVAIGAALVAGAGYLGARALHGDAARTAAFRQRIAPRWQTLGRWIESGFGAGALLRQLGELPARDFGRAAAWLDRNVWDRPVALLAAPLARLGKRRPAVAGAVAIAAAIGLLLVFSMLVAIS